MSGPPDPRPRPRVVNARAGLAKVAAEGRCRCCGSRRLLERHHLVPRSLGGDDVDANIVPMCALCHAQFEVSPVRALVAARVRATLSRSEIAYIVERKGPAFLERYYPPL